MKKEKRFMIIQGRPLDDGTIHIVLIGGKHVLTESEVDNFIGKGPQAANADLKVVQIVDEFTAVHTWKQK